MSFRNNLKHWIGDLFRYPNYRPVDASYDEYWAHRDMNAPLNSFQEERVRRLVSILQPGESVLDIGCGDGRILAAIKSRVGGSGDYRGIDTSDSALIKARSRGLEVTKGDIGDPVSVATIGRYDWVLLLEVLEHVPDSERLIVWAYEHATKGVIFSVPNTGFIFHRLRLLFGRFPLQWRAHPAEHVRFWTVSDMRWWMNVLGYFYKVYTYEGVILLNSIWPSLFAAGLFVKVTKKQIN